jgi:hypothetical protein
MGRSGDGEQRGRVIATPKRVTAVLGDAGYLPLLRMSIGESMVIKLSLSFPGGAPATPREVAGLQLTAAKGRGEKVIDVSATHAVSGDAQGTWTFTVPSATTRNALAGRYAYSVWVTEVSTGEKVPAMKPGTLFVEQSPGST